MNAAGKPIDTDALLAAFDEAVEAEFAGGSDDVEARPKSAKERQEAIREQEYLRRLEILTALPTDIEVAAKKEQCPGCGTAFQSSEPESPGYVPETTMSAMVAKELEPAAVQDDDTTQSEEKKPLICQRCYKLTHYGSIAGTLRVKPVVQSATTPPPVVAQTGPTTARGRSVLSAARFRKILEPLRNKSAVIVYLVDIFDFHGTFLTSLQDIIGDRNPVLLAVNKIDLLPADFKASRVERWVMSECDSLGLRRVAGVHMVSSTKGAGIADLLAEAVRTAKRKGCDIYVVGAANVGKSSFINKVVASRKQHSKKRAGGSGKKKGRQAGSGLTTSVIPGTTLDSIRIPLGRDINLYDTPGIIVNHQLTNRLTVEELRAVLPSKNVECVTYRLGEGKSLFLGGLARIDVLEGKPFFFTVFISPDVKVHPGKTEDADAFLAKHVGGMLTPPFDADRLADMGDWSSKSVTVSGEGWKKASVDIVLSGLGWVSVTGPGSVKLRMNCPRGIGVFTREALMPFEVEVGVSKYTGSRGLNRKRKKPVKKKRSDDADDWI